MCASVLCELWQAAAHCLECIVHAHCLALVSAALPSLIRPSCAVSGAHPPPVDWQPGHAHAPGRAEDHLRAVRHWAHSQPAVCAAPACRPCYTDLLSALKLALRMLAESCGCLLKVACCLLLCCSPSSSDPPLPPPSMQVWHRG